MMRRLRQALAVLLGVIPEHAHVSTIGTLGPDDALVVECVGRLSSNQMQHIEDNLGKLWPGHRIVVLDDSIRLKVLKEERHKALDPGPRESLDQVNEGDGRLVLVMLALAAAALVFLAWVAR